MANQPTKYRKFVVGAASAALVASAVAPVAFAAEFTDVSDQNSHKAAIDALSDKGVISGYPDGTFLPNKTLSRSDVVKMMGKWLVAEGYDVPTDYKTKPRFNDLKSTSNDELLKMAALVKDNGLFVGTPDGNLDPTGDITRENMAIVIVRAFDRVNDIDLASYVAAQDFKKDVVDLKKAKAEAWPAIDVLDFFDITNPAAPNFNPKDTTTRAQFATFLHKTLQADFSDVDGGVVAPGVASVKAVNATTVEVTFKDKVDADNLNSLHFSIDGLTVSNAAVKQTDDKTVVLTTATQKGGEKYTVTLNEKAIGSFTGVSAVVPEKISLNTKSVQGIVGQQVILSADIGVKEAGVPVTFNVKANTTNTLNKDQVFEVVTNAEGIATFSYTQYNAGNDTVTVYPTGKADLREQGTVYWEKTAQLTIKDITEATTLANGSKKVYEINSSKNADKYVFVTFKENLNVTPDKLVKDIKAEGVDTRVLATDGTVGASIADYPYKASTSGEAVIAVKLDSDGKANFVLSGKNATATPIVYEANYTGAETQAARNTLANYKASYKATALQAAATPVTFTVQHALGLTIKAEGNQNAAISNANGKGGRDYVVNYTDKDGKPAAKGTQVRVAIPKAGLASIANFDLLDHIDAKGNTVSRVALAISDNDYLYYDVTLEEAGKATFTVTSTGTNDYVAPTVFVENEKNGLDKNDLQVAAETTYFVSKVNYAAKLKAQDTNGKDVTSVRQGDTVNFIYELVDQNGKVRTADAETKVTFAVAVGTGKVTVNGTQYSAGSNAVYTATIAQDQSIVSVPVVGLEPSSATVTATGSKAGIVISTTTPASQSVAFTSTSVLPNPYTGKATINTVQETISLDGKESVSYATATFKNANAVTLNKQQFEDLIKANNGKAVVTYKKDGDNVSFEIVSLDGDVATTLAGVNAAADATAVEAALVNMPDFDKLTSAQKTAVAQNIFTNRGNGYTVVGLNSQYNLAYGTQVTQAVTTFKTTATLANLKLIPNLDTTEIEALSALGGSYQANALTAVQSAISNSSTVDQVKTAVQTAVAAQKDAAANAGLNTAIAAINTATGTGATATEAALEASKTVLGYATAWDSLSAADKVIAATNINTANTTYNNALAVRNAVAAEVAASTSVAEFTKVELQTNNLVFTFDQNIDVFDAGTSYSIAAGDKAIVTVDGVDIVVTEVSGEIVNATNTITLDVTGEGLALGNNVEKLVITKADGTVLTVVTDNKYFNPVATPISGTVE